MTSPALEAPRPSNPPARSPCCSCSPSPSASAHCWPRSNQPSPPHLRRAEADRHYAEKSYALALPEYQALLKQSPSNAPDRAQINYRVAVALGASQRWDEALAAWDAFLVAPNRGALWSARGHYQRGLLLNRVPHFGYKIGARLHRGNDYPHTASMEKPEQVWLFGDDARAALNDYEAAVKASDRLPHADGETRSEETDLYFDLAKVLPNVQEWGGREGWKAAKATDWAIHPERAYDPEWPQPKKVQGAVNHCDNYGYPAAEKRLPPLRLPDRAFGL